MVRRILRVGRVGASEPELITLGVLRQTPHARLAALVAVSVSVRDSSCTGRLAGVRCSGGAKALSACTWECAGGLFSGLDGATGGTGGDLEVDSGSRDCWCVFEAADACGARERGAVYERRLR